MKYIFLIKNRSSAIYSGIFVSTDYCFTDDWFVDIGGCFLQKYLNLIRDIFPSQTQYHHDTRRSLQSLAMFDPQVNIVGSSKGVQSTIERLASKAKRMQENYLSDDIMDAVLQKIRKMGEPTETHFNTKNMGKEMKDRIKTLEKLVKVDTNKVVNKVGGEVVSIVHQISSELQKLLNSEQMKMVMELASQNSSATFSFNNQFTSITDGFGELEILLKLVKAGIRIACIACNRGWIDCTIIDPFLPLICGEGLTRPL